MRKMKLDADTLQVQSFTAGDFAQLASMDTDPNHCRPSSHRCKGTVEAHATGGPTHSSCCGTNYCYPATENVNCKRRFADDDGHTTGNNARTAVTCWACR